MVDFLEKWYVYDIYIEMHCTSTRLKRNCAISKDIFKILYLPGIINISNIQVN